MGDKWFEGRWALDELLQTEAESWPSEAEAWGGSSDEALLVWMVAQRSTTAAERGALLETVTAVVERLLQGVAFSADDLLAALRSDDEDAALTVHMARAYARACAAVIEAQRTVQRLARLEARGMGERAGGLWPRAVDQMIEALRAAQGAFGHRAERDGGVRARSATPAATIRERHRPS